MNKHGKIGKVLIHESLAAVVTRTKGLSMQVCVPREWTNEQVMCFADRENPAGTENGWFLAEAGDKALAGAKPVVQCADQADHVHRVLVV